MSAPPWMESVARRGEPSEASIVLAFFGASEPARELDPPPKLPDRADDRVLWGCAIRPPSLGRPASARSREGTELLHPHRAGPEVHEDAAVACTTRPRTATRDPKQAFAPAARGR